MRLALFIIANAILFIRPSELIPGWEGVQLFEPAMILSLLAGVVVVWDQLRPANLLARPMTLCVVGLMPAVLLSHAFNGGGWDAMQSGSLLMLKLLLYYLLVVGNLDSHVRLRVFQAAVVVFMSVQVGLGLLQYFGVINIEALAAFKQQEFDPTTGALKIIPRLCGCGIFHDPNDLCVLLAVSCVFCLDLVFDRGLHGFLRFLCLPPLIVFLAAIPLTHSRGGLLAVLAGLGTLALSAMGRKGLWLLLLVVPVALVAMGGRMTRFEVDNADDTSQHRMRAWSDGLVAVRSSPLIGLGQGTYPDVAGLQAHNSYVETFTELGLFGGSLFVCVIGYAVWALVRLPKQPGFDRLGPLAHVRPFALAVVVASAVGLLSLSREYVQPTYLVFGFVAGYLRLVEDRLPGSVPPLSTRMVFAGIGFGVLMLILLMIGTASLVRR